MRSRSLEEWCLPLEKHHDHSSATNPAAKVTIKKGESWGEPGVLEESGLVVSTDYELAELLQGYRMREQVPPVIAVLGGALHRTLGSPQRDVAALRSGQGYVFPLDVGILQFFDSEGTQREVLFVAHCQASTDPRMRLWKGRTVLAMNASFMGTLNLGPRAHPNDGRLDVTEGQLKWAERKQARSRAVTGAHLPHPSLHERRVSSRMQFSSGSMFDLSTDGRLQGKSAEFSITCIPDAARILV